MKQMGSILRRFGRAAAYRSPHSLQRIAVIWTECVIRSASHRRTMRE
jgi:hypothetical protein